MIYMSKICMVHGLTVIASWELCELELYAGKKVSEMKRNFNDIGTDNIQV